MYWTWNTSFQGWWIACLQCCYPQIILIKILSVNTPVSSFLSEIASNCNGRLDHLNYTVYHTQTQHKNPRVWSGTRFVGFDVRTVMLPLCVMLWLACCTHKFHPTGKPTVPRALRLAQAGWQIQLLFENGSHLCECWQLLKFNSLYLSSTSMFGKQSTVLITFSGQLFKFNWFQAFWADLWPQC